MIKFWLFVLAVPFCIWSFNRILAFVKDWADYGLSKFAPPDKRRGRTGIGGTDDVETILSRLSIHYDDKRH